MSSVVLVFIGFYPDAGAYAQPGDGRPLSTVSNLDIMHSLIDRLTREVVQQAKPTPGVGILLIVRSSEESWITESAVSTALKSLGLRVFLAGNSTEKDSAVHFEVHEMESKVAYEDPFHDGFLGTEMVRRKVSSKLICQMSDGRSHEIIYSGSPSIEQADTIRMSDVPSLEKPTVRSTRGELPSGSFLDKVAEPFMIIGATGVIVYLLFHVRS